MDEEFEQPRRQGGEIGRSLETMSVDELERYKTRLQGEIERVEAEKKRKVQIKMAAEQLFKSNG